MRENQKRRNIEVLVMSSVLCLISIPPSQVVEQCSIAEAK